MEPLMTAQQVADLLVIDINTLYQYVKKGNAPKTIRIGSSIRFDPADVQTWLTEQTEATK